MATKFQIFSFILLINVVYGQFTFVNFLNSILNTGYDSSEGLTRDENNFLSEYDFIVIGSGSGGSVVTNRLTEVPNWSLLLLEAGRDETFITEIPLTASLLELTDYNWGYKAERQSSACTALKNGVCNFPTGKALGGTSVINYMLYTRGNKLDYDEWQEAGNEGWSYQDVLPYFIKSERAKGLINADRNFHGSNGYLDVEHSPYRSPLVDRFLESANEFGYENTDINGEKSIGFTLAQANMRNGRRCSAAKAFLRPIRRRRNLHISKRSYVTKILIDPITKQAYGVEFRKNQRIYKVRVKKEVILAAGVINSAQLLMLSGIGPKSHLDQLNIPVIQDLPVGLNLQDHISLPGLAFLVNNSVTLTTRKFTSPYAVFDNLVNHKGPYTIPGGAEAFAFINTNSSELPNSDIELVLASSAISNDATGVIRNLLGLTDVWYNTLYEGIKGKEAFSIVPVLLKPKSRGKVMLRNKNPFAAPLIYPNFLTDKRDLGVIVEGIKMAVAVGESHSFQKYNSHLHKRPYPGCEEHPFRSDEYWRCCVQRYTSSLYHPVGTCKMGPSKDPTAVVDPQLKVKGVQGLRVVDGSIMPTIVAGHTNAAIFMIGEKASDMIKDTWKDSERK